VPLSAGFLLLAGCGREDIQVYRVPKEKTMLARDSGEAASRPTVQFKTPPGWKEEAAGGMRVARFTVPGKDGQDADVSIIPLPGISARKEDIVNLWREQIHLEPIQGRELSNQLENVQIGPQEAELFDMVSAEPLIANKFKQRILVAMLGQGSTTWFIKMTGEDALVREQKPAFLSFLNSVTFEPGADHPTVASAPPFASANVPTASAGGDEASPAKPEWSAPADWKEQPPTQMLLAKFLLGGQSGGKAEVTVSVFPGDTGGLFANVNRWRGQLGLEPIDQGQVKALPSLDVTGGKATVVDVTGTNPRTGQKARLIGAIVPREGQTWFYKLMGDEAVAEQQKAAFVKFVQTVHYPDAH
jgi:hypothetical protein